jgi:rod shape-determining protein MreD
MSAMQASVKQFIEADINRLPAWVSMGAVVAALLLQAYLPLFSSYANTVDLPLLIAIYLTLLRRSPIVGLLIGLGIGLGQDSLSHGPIGIYGIIKTVIGYVCSSLTLVLAVEPLATRLVLVMGFYLIHQASFWAMQRVLLGQTADFVWRRTLLLALLNCLVAALVYRFLDRFRQRI